MSLLQQRRRQLAESLLGTTEPAGPQMEPAPQDALTQGLLAMFGGYMPIAGLNTAQKLGMVPGGDLAGYGGDLYEQVMHPAPTTGGRGVQAFSTALGLAPFMHPGAQKAAANGLVDLLGMEAARYGPSGMSWMDVYHGSPHRWAPEPGFPAGRPRLDKVGTGEGAQAYGHGVYFAEAPGVARDYQKRLGMRQVEIDGKPIDSWQDLDNRIAGDIAAKFDFGYSPQDAKVSAVGEYAQKKARAEWLLEDMKKASKQGSEWGDLATTFDDLEEEVQRATYALDRIKKFDPTRVSVSKGGSFYTLDLPDERVPGLLDWDKPLVEQPETVKEAIKPILEFWQQQGGTPVEEMMKTWRGETLVDRAAFPARRMGLGNKDRQQAAAEILAAYGVPGLRYLDAGSRAGSGGTSNFVIWDQSLLDEMGRRMAKTQGLLSN